MTTGNDPGGMVPQIVPCTDCGQADPWHLPICPQLGGVTPAVVDQVDQAEHDLGQAI